MKIQQSLPVLDSSAVLAYLEDEPGAEVVEAALASAHKRGLALPVSVVNWGEVLYVVERERGLSALKAARAAIEELPVAVVDADRRITATAARIKARGDVSFADAFCCALALELGVPVLTRDPEFASVEGLTVEWLPAR